MTFTYYEVFFRHYKQLAVARSLYVEKFPRFTAYEIIHRASVKSSHFYKTRTRLSMNVYDICLCLSIWTWNKIKFHSRLLTLVGSEVTRGGGGEWGALCHRRWERKCTSQHGWYGFMYSHNLRHACVHRILQRP